MPSRAPYELFRDDRSPFWYVYFLDRSGRRIRRSTRETNKARAHAVAKELERRHADPTHRASDATTIADAVSRFVASLTDAGRSAETCRFYDVKLRHLARVFGASTPLAKVTAASVDDFIQTRLAEGAERYTVSKELTALRGVLKVARRRGEFDKDVGQVLPIAFATGYKPRTRRVTIAEAWTLIRDLPDGTARYMAFVCATTARDAAVYRARGCDLTHVGIRVHDQKTALAARVVPLTAVTEPFARFAFRDLAADDRVCPTGESAMRHAFNRSTARLGWPHLSPNDIRRSVAHWLLEGGVPRDVVAAFMGHASTTMLDRVYGKLEAAEVGAAIARTLRK